MIRKWIVAMIAPSYSTPLSEVTVKGEKAFQIIFSLMLVAMNSEIPEPIPYPFDRSSSSSITKIPAKTSWKMSSMQLVTPMR